MKSEYCNVVGSMNCSPRCAVLALSAVVLLACAGGASAQSTFTVNFSYTGDGVTATGTWTVQTGITMPCPPGQGCDGQVVGLSGIHNGDPMSLLPQDTVCNSALPPNQCGNFKNDNGVAFTGNGGDAAPDGFGIGFSAGGIDYNLHFGTFEECSSASCITNIALTTVAPCSIVTNTADSGPGSLRDALACASDGDTIDATGVSGTITLTTGELVVSNSITILGPGPATLSVDGNAASRVFHITNAVTVVISGLTITNGSAGAGTFPADAGGGILNDHATLTVSNCVLSGNSASFGGGGIYNDGRLGSATLTMSLSTLNGSSANLGGGIYNDGSGSGSAALAMSRCILSGNSANFGQGGGVYNDGSGSGRAILTVSSSTLGGNVAGTSGGGILNEGASGTATVTIVTSTLCSNTAGVSGGGIFNDGFSGSGTLTVITGILSGNSANFGGGAILNNDNGAGSAI